MRVAVTGASGLVGSALCEAVLGAQHQVVRLVRRPARGEGEAGYDPESAFHDPGRIEGCAAVVHLAGESLGDGRWTDEKERAIRRSRFEGTRKLCQNVSMLAELPEVIIVVVCNCSYGDRGDEVLSERSTRGKGPAAEFGQDWEDAAGMVEAVGMRLVLARLGIVLSARGGVLPVLARAQREGRAGVLAGGSQWLPWIHEQDAVAALQHLIATPALSGPVNVVAPAPVRQRDLAAALASTLGVPPAPALDAGAAREVLGDMAGELLLPSRRVQPEELLRSGFAFRHAALQEALVSLLR